MHACLDFRRFRSRIGHFASFRRKEKKRIPVISAPFDFKREGGIPAGMSEDEVLLMREKAAASRIGVADDFLGASQANLAALALHPTTGTSVVPTIASSTAAPSRSSSLATTRRGCDPGPAMTIDLRVASVGPVVV